MRSREHAIGCSPTRASIPRPNIAARGLKVTASHTSVRVGETISFHVSTNPASRFTLDLYRLGYYGGDGGRLVQKLDPFDGKALPDPPIGPKRVRDCAWESCTEFKIPDDWVSGVYLGKLTAEQRRPAELRHLHRARRPPRGFSISVQRQHLVGLQPLALAVRALR